MSLLPVKTAALPFLKKVGVEGGRDVRVHRSCHMTRISASKHFACWVHSSGRATQTRHSQQQHVVLRGAGHRAEQHHESHYGGQQHTEEEVHAVVPTIAEGQRGPTTA